MNEHVQGENGQFGTKLTEQDVLKVFDYETDAKEPMLKTSEIRSALQEHFGIEVSGQTVRRRLQEMEGKNLVASKNFGASAKGWTALVGPRLSATVESESDQILSEEGTEELGDVASDLGVDLN